MLEYDEVDLAYRLLDLDLTDADGRRCGKVDDIELTGEPGETTHVAGLISGPGALGRRFPRRLRALGRWLFRGGTTAVAWRHVEDVEATVCLDETAATLGLGSGDRALRELAGEGRG